MNKKFFITTAIYYVNASPHIGHALEKVQADVVARYHRILGEEVFFLTGTDENSLKNVQAAEKEEVSVKELVDRNSRKFYELKNILNLSFDDFIRTTKERHVKGAQKFWLACSKDIYKKAYQGLYCVGCEEFYKESELENGFCPEHKTKPELIEEKNYFFQLSKYQNELKKIIESDKIKIIPKTRKNEALSFINSGLEDICISRSAERAKGWGIDVPGDPSQKIWVWFDALSNYINALEYGENNKKFQEWWQDNKNKLHIIGKGILRFHAIYWPAMLLSAKLSLPKAIFVHGYITFSSQKMSKSLGNVVDPFELVEKYGTDAVRYFLLREIPPTKDGDFTYEKFKERYNSDLASGLGNLVSRVLALAENKDITANPGFFNPEKINKEYAQAIEKFQLNLALEIIWGLITKCDQYIEKERPWDLSSNDLNTVLNNLFGGLEHISYLLQPFLPETSKEISQQLKTKKGKPLFPRV